MYIYISKIYKYNNEEIWFAGLIFYGYLSELPLYMIFLKVFDCFELYR